MRSDVVVLFVPLLIFVLRQEAQQDMKELAKHVEMAWEKTPSKRGVESPSKSKGDARQPDSTRKRLFHTPQKGSTEPPEGAADVSSHIGHDSDEDGDLWQEQFENPGKSPKSSGAAQPMKKKKRTRSAKKQQASQNAQSADDDDGKNPQKKEDGKPSTFAQDGPSRQCSMDSDAFASLHDELSEELYRALPWPAYKTLGCTRTKSYKVCNTHIYVYSLLIFYMHIRACMCRTYWYVHENTIVARLR